MTLADDLVAQSPFDIGSGRVLFLGDETSTYLFDIATRSLTALQMPAFAMASAVVPLPDGRLVTIGDRFETRLLDPTQLP